MIQICYRKANKARINNINNLIISNIKYYGRYTVVKDNQVLCKVVKEIIRINDAECEEYEYAKKKFSNEIDFPHLKARETFPSGVNIITLKYCYRFNLTGVRDNFINKNTIVKDYLRCGDNET